MVHAGRLTGWAGQGGLRATGISGFRRGLCTVDDISILQTLRKQTRNRRQKYSCFVDFREAFGFIPRQQLGQVLKHKRVKGPILHSLISMYAQDIVCVLTQKGLSGKGLPAPRVSSKDGQPARSSSACTWMTWRPWPCAQQPGVLRHSQKAPTQPLMGLRMGPARSSRPCCLLMISAWLHWACTACRSSKTPYKPSAMIEA